MVSKKVIAVLIVLSLLLLVFSLIINMSLSNDEINYKQEVPIGNPQASISLVITPPANSGAAVG